MKLASLFLLAVLVPACSSVSPDSRALRHASEKLGKPATALRITRQSDLTGDHHDFFLATQRSGPSLLVVVPAQGPPFDSRTPDAFTRVARAEDASRRLAHLGAERVALWFASLADGCPLPSSDDVHFATAEPLPDGVRIRYPAGKSGVVLRTCVIDLAADGALREARLTEQRDPAASSRRWRSGS